MDDLLRDFLAESAENLAQLDQEVVQLEKMPDDRELLTGIFRTVHTIKGTCGFLDLARLESVAHAAESVLGRLRDGEITATSEIISDILAAVDVIKLILLGLEETGAEPEGDDSALSERLQRWAGDAREEVDPETFFLPASGFDAAEEAPASGGGAAASGGSVRGSSLRVGVELLDQLMNLAGELVLTRNRLEQLSRDEEDSAYSLPLQQLHRVTTDLQEAVMKTRMQPIGNAWGKLPRLVRDLCQLTGKQIELEMIGAHTELDRQILQAIQDPLTHMVRNSADHGIEPPAVRSALGKPEAGTIRLEAFHEGGQIVIEIRDDGKGLDAEAIRARAVKRGLLRAELADGLTDAQAFRFVFEPGFSTAEQVTSISGRGVGMDVVRANIEKIGGAIDLSSTRGAGTTIRIKIPLTLAILPALTVGSGGQCFAIPQVGVLELVRITSTNRDLLDSLNGAEFFRLRDILLPVVRLSSALCLGPESESEPSLVVCQVGSQRFGLLVDEIFDTHEIVVKPTGRLVQGLACYSGTTILGDGRVVMILDVPGIAAEHRITERVESTAAHSGTAPAQTEEETGRIPLVVFRSGGAAPRAVPLRRVSRLEKIPTRDIEHADGRWLVQYRGALLPLVPAHPGMDVRAVPERPVIVFSIGARSVGLAVDEIEDIVEDRLHVELDSASEGVLGTAVVGGRSTVVLDIDAVLGGLGTEAPVLPSLLAVVKAEEAA